MKEFELINKFLAQRAGNRDDVILGIGDDCALLKIPQNCTLAVSTDNLVAGIHFPHNATAYDIGYKTLAANLSDLAAMGAEPAWVSLTITLPVINEAWLKEFCDGFFVLLKQYNMQLIGGDTTRGPLALTAQVYGFVPTTHRVPTMLRSGAKPGDLIYVTGTLGDAGYGLHSTEKYFLQKLNRPTPRIKEGIALRGKTTSAIDISDGLAADLEHILEQSNVGATIYIDDLPLSDKLLQAVPKAEAIKLALTAGDDYELCFTIPVELNNFSGKISKIGIIEKQPGLRILDHVGNPVVLEQKGYEHSWERT